MKFNLFICVLLLYFISSCGSSDDYFESTDNSHATIDDTLVAESITKDLFVNILNGLRIAEIIKSDRNNSPISSNSSKSTMNKTSKDNCQHEIRNSYENKNFVFDLTQPITKDIIEAYKEADIISTTDSSIKYFLADGTPSTDCDTEEVQGPIPNHDDRDALLRPTFYSYSSLFDYKGEHHYSNLFYLEKSEITTSKYSDISSKFVTEGTVEKRIDREHQVHVWTLAEHSYIEDLDLRGFIESQQGYRFYFMNGSSKYFKHSYSIKNELDDNPTYENMEIDMVDRYAIQFYINYRDGANRVDGVFRVPFFFDITIDYKQIIEILKNNQNSDSYTKTVELYVVTGNVNRSIGNIKYTLANEEKWEVNITESPLYLSDTEIEQIIVNFN